MNETLTPTQNQKLPFYKIEDVAAVKRRIPEKGILMKTIMNRNADTRNRIISAFKKDVYVIKFTKDTISSVLKYAANQCMEGNTKDEKICRGNLSQTYFKEIDSNGREYNAVLIFYGQRIIGFCIYKVEIDTINIDLLCTNKIGCSKLDKCPLGQILLEYVIHLVNGRKRKIDKKTKITIEAVRNDDTLKFYYDNDFVKMNTNDKLQGSTSDLLKMVRRLENTSQITQSRQAQKLQFKKFYQEKAKHRKYLQTNPNYKDAIIPIQNDKGIILHSSFQNQQQKASYSGNINYIGDIRQNKKNGVGKEYDVYGYLIYEGQYKNGVRDGEGTLYKLYHNDRRNTFKNGKLFSGKFTKGEYTEGKKYYENGHLMYDGIFLNERFKKGKKYNINGQLIEEKK